MNRELKFRIWDKDKKFFVKGEYPSFIGNIDGIYKFNKNYHFLYSIPTPQKSKNWIIQQYTGLKDVNNKEIFEGDIILNNNANNRKMIIEWNNKTCSFISTDNINKKEKIGIDYLELWQNLAWLEIEEER